MSNNNSAIEIAAKFIVILVLAAIMLSVIGGVVLQWVFVIPAIAMIVFVAKQCSRKL